MFDDLLLRTAINYITLYIPLITVTYPQCDVFFAFFFSYFLFIVQINLVRILDAGRPFIYYSLISHTIVKVNFNFINCSFKHLWYNLCYGLIIEVLRSMYNISTNIIFHMNTLFILPNTCVWKELVPRIILFLKNCLWNRLLMHEIELRLLFLLRKKKCIIVFIMKILPILLNMYIEIIKYFFFFLIEY